MLTPICSALRKIAKSDCSLSHVCPSVFMEQFGSHGTIIKTGRVSLTQVVNIVFYLPGIA